MSKESPASPLLACEFFILSLFLSSKAALYWTKSNHPVHRWPDPNYSHSSLSFYVSRSHFLDC